MCGMYQYMISGTDRPNHCTTHQYMHNESAHKVLYRFGMEIGHWTFTGTTRLGLYQGHCPTIIIGTVVLVKAATCTSTNRKVTCTIKYAYGHESFIIYCTYDNVLHTSHPADHLQVLARLHNMMRSQTFDITRLIKDMSPIYSIDAQYNWNVDTCKHTHHHAHTGCEICLYKLDIRTIDKIAGQVFTDHAALAREDVR